ncbi:MAG: phenylalanine--tRNA ligase subunit alpha [Anaerolineales bacterium]|nr:MAG: phenylalanine--tRNA ligase subunit alpha [Anaerolineales bacterium]
MLKQLDEIQEQALAALEAVPDLAELEAWRIKHQGKKSTLNQILRDVGKLPREERPAVGKRGNEVKVALEAAYEAKKQALERGELAELLEKDRIDVTLPGRPAPLGRIHISTKTLREIYAIFAQMGFQVYTARDVELDLYNFELLNMPPGHPARDMWDTFYTTREDVVLRTHTSPGQIHAMREYCPEPIRVILPGKCYRYEQVTARSEFMFYQVEGLAVGKRITMTDLKGVMAEFARQMFGADRRMRFRASYFPFTEPSVEVDMDCIICSGEGCRVCKYTGWLEIAGAGMVHPIVLQNGGYDPAVYSGFAFGMGPERIAMLKHDIDDIRYFFSNDLRFLGQF